MTHHDEHERRRHPRYPVDVPVKVTRGAESTSRSYLGRGTNIGEGGLEALIATELNVSERIQVEITVPYSSQPIKIAAVVTSRNGYRYGLQFLPLNHSEQQAINRACEVLALMHN